ncbi:uncharacterized protein cubi_01646 [Cryptosporidium ubiquitum]|uniref:Protein phosphatase inhibitor n=1 Tax=Cryptosporidium ubiquitum TaxID=857276 RepID=A0A1J4MEN3_9CRYT|nr:uncharacterized protein cubi_01646 [Cryptosporidium ubiquitum]OII72696.1 hypothetical protein cubi_01646 [Cryptosporidium ubiquitum]
MSQTIYKTDTNTLTILKVENKCNIQQNTENESRHISENLLDRKELSATEYNEEINKDYNINQNIDKTHRKSTNNVTWDESAIDNEMMNKKKSKKCCIFHKKRNFGESSSSDSDTDSDSDDNGDDQDTYNCKNKRNQCSCDT